jgi:hypothetical protein
MIPVPAASTAGTMSEPEKTTSASVAVPTASAEKIPIPDSTIPVKKEVPEIAASVPVSVEREATPLLPAPAPVSVERETTPQFSASAPVPVTKEAVSLFSASAPLPAVKDHDSSLSAPVPLQAVRESFAEADHPLASVPAAQTESLSSGSVAQLESVSDLVSRLSSVMQPAGNTVNNTSNNLSAPVTINVNARGSDAEQIGETIYNTAERYLLRTLRSSFPL